MSKFTMALVCWMLATVAFGEEARRGFTVRDGQLILIGEFKQLSGIQVESKNGQLSLAQAELPAGAKLPEGVKIESKEPFGNEGAVIKNTPQAIVMGVLGAQNQRDIKGETSTAIRYAGNNPQENLEVSIGDGMIPQPQKISWLPGKVSERMPAHVAKTLQQMVGEWTAESKLGDKKTVVEFSTAWVLEGSALRYQWKSGERDAASSGTGIIGWNAAKHTIVEHEIESSGAESHATHRINQDGNWTSPMQGTWIVDGHILHYQLDRTIKFRNENEWTMKFTNVRVDDQVLADRIRTYRRVKKQ